MCARSAHGLLTQDTSPCRPGCRGLRWSAWTPWRNPCCGRCGWTTLRGRRRGRHSTGTGRRPAHRGWRVHGPLDGAACGRAATRADRSCSSRRTGSRSTATGRNGGFCEASRTHGEANGRERWPDEYDAMHELGMRNLDEIEQTLERLASTADGRGAGSPPWRRGARGRGAGARSPGFLDAAAVQQLVASPTYLAGRLDAGRGGDGRPGPAGVGLADAAEGLGVLIAEGTRLESMKKGGDGVVAPPRGSGAREARGARDQRLPGPLRRSRRVVPVYDYVLATEP